MPTASTHAPQDPAGILAAHKLRVTEQRVTVLTAMLAEPNDVTAQGLYERLRPASPNLGMATVYRTLNALADAGVLDRLHHDASAACYRYCTPGHHHHLTCRACHTVVELRDCDLKAWTTRLGRRYGFRSVSHSLELEGICNACHRAAG